MKRRPKTRQTKLQMTTDSHLNACHAPVCLKAPSPKTAPSGTFALSKDSVCAPESLLFFSDGAKLAVCMHLAEPLAPLKRTLLMLKHPAHLVARYL